LTVATSRTTTNPNLYKPEQLEYLSGRKTVVTDRGGLKEVPLRQSLEERLQVVPDLLARSVHRRYKLPKNSAAIRKLRRTIELRDAIIHPRWDRYLPSVSAMEAAQAVDAVELYLNSVQRQLHPYLVGYIAALLTIRGYDKHDVAIGHRTEDKRVPKTKFVTMTSVGIGKVLVQSWMDMVMICGFALESGCEGDSEGSLLTRVALVLLFAGVDSQLSIVAKAVVAVRAYFEELGRKAPETFKAQVALLPAFEIPDEEKIKASIKAESERWKAVKSRFNRNASIARDTLL